MRFTRRYLLLVLCLLVLIVGGIIGAKIVLADISTDFTPPKIIITINCTNSGGSIVSSFTSSGRTCPSSAVSANVHIDYSDYEGGLQTVNHTITGDSSPSNACTFVPGLGYQYCQYNSPSIPNTTPTPININASATDNAGNINNTYANVAFTFSFLYQITGNVYDDSANGNCTSNTLYNGSNGPATATPNSPSGSFSQSGASYSWINIPQGSYSVTLTLPSGYALSPCNSTIFPFSLPPNQVHNFYIRQTYSISGVVYDDSANGNCTSTTPYGGAVTITPNSPVGTFTNGVFYSWTNIPPPGPYSVTLTIPSGYAMSPCSFATSPSYGVPPSRTYNFFITRPFTISGTVYLDSPSNPNCTSQSQAVGLITSTNFSINPSVGTPVLSGTTYTYSVFPGSYSITLTPPAGYTLSPCSGVQSATVPPNATNKNFYIYANTISGTIFLDANLAPACSSNTPATTAGITAANFSINPSGYTPTVTNAAYMYSPVASGTYSITFTPPAGYKMSSCPGNTGTLSGITVPPNKTGQNFWIVQTYSISGNVFVDYNHNGARDPGDIGYSGITTITLSGTSSRSTTTDVNGNYTFSNLIAGTYTVTLSSLIPGYTMNYSAALSNPRNVILPPTTASVDFSITPLYGIKGDVFIDCNKNGIKDTSGTGTCTGGDVNYTGPSTIEIHQTSDPACTPATLLNVSGVIIGSGVTIGSGVVVPTAGTINTTNGSYDTGLGLLSGIYTVCLSAVPSGYVMTYPKNAIGSGKPYFVVTLGYPAASPACSTGTPPALNASCYSPASPFLNGSIKDLDFGISNSIPWKTCDTGDCRYDNGYTSTVPSAPLATCAFGGLYVGKNSVAYSGDNTNSKGPNPSAHWTNNQGTAADWIVGGLSASSFPEQFSPSTTGVIRTSYQYLLTKVQQNIGTPPALTVTQCGGGFSASGNCNLATLDSSGGLGAGVYAYTGNVTFTDGVAVAPGQRTNARYGVGANRNIIILINGNLTIKQQILVPAGSTFFVSVSGNLTVDPSLGLDHAGVDSTGDVLQGFYSADGTVIIDGFDISQGGGCMTGHPDWAFRNSGAMIANAGLSITSAFQFNRDLCEGYQRGSTGQNENNNSACPANQMKARPDMLLNAPSILRSGNTVWQEVAP